MKLELTQVTKFVFLNLQLQDELDASGNSPLSLAAMKGSTSLVEILLRFPLITPNYDSVLLALAQIQSGELREVRLLSWLLIPLNSVAR